MKQSLPKPTLAEELRLWKSGYRHIAGLDEAGRGALAGPVVAAAVVVPPQSKLRGLWTEVTDSKLLSPDQRTTLEPQIKEMATAWSVGVVSAVQIDEIGIGPATRRAMMAALADLAVLADYLLIDWVRLPNCSIEQESYTKADQRIVSVAAASILAKVHRDRLLTALHNDYPRYGFAQHKGYGTTLHRTALEAYGPCPEHRHSFAPIARERTLFDHVDKSNL